MKIESEEATPFSTQIRGRVKGSSGDYQTSVTLDGDGKIVDADCGCAWFTHNALRGGPCKHVMALRESVASAATDVAVNESADWWSALV